MNWDLLNDYESLSLVRGHAIVRSVSDLIYLVFCKLFVYIHILSSINHDIGVDKDLCL